MNTSELGNLTLLARTAYAIMCFERYVGFVYSGVSFKPVAEMMWQMVDGTAPMEEAAFQYLEILPENLFAHDSYEKYQSLGNSHLSADEYRVFTRILNPHDWNLKTMMKHIFQIATEYVRTSVTPGAPETLPYLQAVADMLTVRKIALPDLRLLQRYTCAADDPSANWMGEPIDPAPLSLLGITSASAPDEASAVRTLSESDETPVVHNAFGDDDDDSRNVTVRSAAGYDGFERSYTDIKPDSGDRCSFYDSSTRPVIDANGCKWEIDEEDDGIIITRCINSYFRTEIEIPAELNGLPVIAIDDSAFTDDHKYGCAFIEKLTMPDSIRRIGDYFFRSCANLRQINMPAELRRIGNEAFRGASRLEHMIIGDNCRVIGDYFCADAVSLRDVLFGAGMEILGEYSFYNTPRMTSFRCDGMFKELGYGSFWVNKWADGILFNPETELLRFCRNNALLYRYVKRNPPARLFFDAGIKYVYDFAFGGDAWHSGEGITDIYFPGATKIGVQAFRKTPNATVHLSASLMRESYGPDYEYTLKVICEPAAVVFDQP